MRLKEFFDTDFKEFSNADNVRSIPSVIDGFKDSQRKAIYGMLDNGNMEIKVSQAASSIALLTHYAHGEASLAGTLVGLAQNFPGSNNVNLLEPIGQFGSILSAEASSPRYIYTRPSSYMRQYIRTEDECILEHRYEDGDKAEPIYFLPVLPMWIVNGAIGVGTGHSVKILNRDPSAIKQYIEKKLSNINQQEKTIDKLMLPSFTGWTGDVIKVEDGKYELHGKLEVVNTTTIRVTELPIGYGVDKFKAILVDLIEEGKVKDYDNNSTESGFDFEVKVPREVSRLDIDELKKLFKLISRITENVTLWDTDGCLTNYPTVKDALDEFIQFRLSKYEERRLKQIEIISDELDFLLNKKKFILTWNDLDNPGKKSTSDLEQIMIKSGIKEEYLQRLFSLRISSLTLDQIDALNKEIQKKESEKTDLENKTNSQIYLEEIGKL